MKPWEKHKKTSKPWEKYKTMPEDISYNPTDEMSGVEKFAAGIGKSIYDTGRGIGNLLNLVSDEEVAQARVRDEGLMDTGAGIAGNVTGHIGQMALPGAAVMKAGKALNSTKATNIGREMLNPSNWKTGAAVGGGYGYIQPGTQEERLLSGGFGALGGAVGGAIANKLAGANPKAVTSSIINQVTGKPEVKITGGGYNFGSVTPDNVGLNAAQKEALKLGEDLGFKVTPGQRSGSRAFQQMEAKLESQPMTSAPFNKIKDENQTLLNQIAAKSIGETSDTVDWQVLGRAKDRLSDFYKSVSDDVPRVIDPDEFLTKMSGFEESVEGLINGQIVDDVLVKQFIKMAEKGQATGHQLQNLASKLGKSAQTKMTSNAGERELGIALYRIKDYVDDLLESGMDAAKLTKFKEARNQYRNLMLLTNRNSVLNASSGDIKGNALAGLLQSKDKGGFTFGKNKGDLYNAARFSQAFRPLFNDSGTATRSVIPSPTDYVMSLPFNVTTSAYLNSPNMINGLLQAGKKAAPALPYLGYSMGGLLSNEIR